MCLPPEAATHPKHTTPTHLHTTAVYDVTRAESFENLERIWMKEVDIYSNIEDAVKMVVANKVDLVRHFGVVVVVSQSRLPLVAPACIIPAKSEHTEITQHVLPTAAADKVASQEGSLQ